MRKLLVGTVLGLSMFSALAHAIPDWLIPSPITIAIQIGKWILSEDSNEEVYYIRVQSKGATETEARNEAFRLAVDQAIGSLLVSETEVTEDGLRRHDVINYSSGFIYDFEYVNIYRGAGEVVLQVDVWVKKSKIAERISLNNSASGNLEGGRIAEAFKSIQGQQQTSDQLLQIILNDYPHRAYHTNIDKLEYTYEQRTPYLHIYFSTWWNQKYVESFKEVLSNIGQVAGKYDTKFSIGFFEEHCVFCKPSKYLIEPQQASHVFMTFVEPAPVVLAQLLDVAGNVVHQGCVRFEEFVGGGYYRTSTWEPNGVGINIYAERNNQQTIRYNLTGVDVDKLDTVTLSFIRQNNCKT